MSRDPLLGNLFENLVVMEALKSRWNQGVDPDLYHIRDAGGFEIDLALSRQRQLFPVEIKAARTYRTEFFKNLDKAASWSDSIQPGAVIYAGEEAQKIQGHSLIPFAKMASWFKVALGVDRRGLDSSVPRLKALLTFCYHHPV